MPPRPTILGLTRDRLLPLAAAAGFARPDIARASAVLAEGLQGWGEAPIADRPRPSDLSDDASPVELSLSLDGRAAAEVRVLFEVPPRDAVGSDREIVSQFAAARELNARLARRFDVPLERLASVEDLFAPRARSARWGMWHCFGVRPAEPPRFKVYLNPQASGPDLACGVVTGALERLELPRVARTVSDAPRDEELRFFSLDLARSAAARVKVYRVHPGATRERIEAELRRTPAYCAATFDRFWRAVAPANRPLDAFPASTYAAYTGDSDRPRSATVHVPVRAYAPDDAHVHERILGLLCGSDRDVYRRAIAAFASRPLAAGVGLIAYVSLALDERPRFTVYLSTEMYRVEPSRNERGAVA